MKYMFIILFFMNMAFANEATETSATPVAKKESAVQAARDGINFQEWESEFDNSMEKAKVRVRSCESSSKNCQFEKFQALDPSFDMVH